MSLIQPFSLFLTFLAKLSNFWRGVAIFAPLIAPHDPYAQSLSSRMLPPVWVEGGQWEHLLGTDQNGRRIHWGLGSLLGLARKQLWGVGRAVV